MQMNCIQLENYLISISADETRSDTNELLMIINKIVVNNIVN